MKSNKVKSLFFVAIHSFFFATLYILMFLYGPIDIKRYRKTFLTFLLFNVLDAWQLHMDEFQSGSQQPNGDKRLAKTGSKLKGSSLISNTLSRSPDWTLNKRRKLSLRLQQTRNLPSPTNLQLEMLWWSWSSKKTLRVSSVFESRMSIPYSASRDFQVTTKSSSCCRTIAVVSHRASLPHKWTIIT